MKKRTILGLCLSIFSLILFSCGIADNNKGNASFTLDTAKIAQRSVQSANFSEVSDEEIFLKYAEYVYFDLSAIVHYEIDGEATDQTFDLWSMNGKEAYELVEKLQNMSGEDEEAYFVEKFSSQTLTITDLPIGKNATFRLKIRQKVGFNIDLSEYGLSESETTKEEYLAISKKPVTARIGEDTDIKIVIGEYDSSLDWEETDGEDEITGLPWTLTGTFPSEWSSDLEFLNGEIFIYKKTGSTWNLVDTVILTSENPGFTVTSNIGTGSGTTKNLSTGDTAMLTIRMMYAYNESAGGHTCFAGWSKEVTCASGKNVFDMGEVTYKANFWGNPAPTTTATVLVTSENEITAKYGTITVFTTEYSSETGQSTSTELLTKEIELSDCVKTSSSKDNSGYSSYQATYTFSDISAFSNVEEETMLNATLVLYEDSARTKQTNESQGGLSGFYKDCSNVFSFYIYDESSSSGSGKAGTYWDNSNGLPEPVLFVNYNGTEYKSTDSANTLTVTADGKSITFANKYLGNDDEWHYYAGMIFDCEYDDTAIPTDAVKWYLNDSQIFQAQVDGTITLTIGETDYNNGGTGVGAAELKTGENTIKVEATYNGNTKTAEMTFIVN